MGKVLRLRSVGVAFAAVVVMAVVWSCNNTGCLDNQNSLPLAGFYAYPSGRQLSISTVEIGGVGAPNDSLLCTSGTAISQVYLPFRSDRTSTSFYIVYTDSALVAHNVCDTMTYVYDSYPYLASEDCGAMYRYRVTSVSYTRNVVDSIAVTDSLITNTEAERIRIYFRVNQ